MSFSEDSVIFWVHFFFMCVTLYRERDVVVCLFFYVLPDYLVNRSDDKFPCQGIHTRLKVYLMVVLSGEEFQKMCRWIKGGSKY